MQRARSMSAAANNEAASFRVPPRYRFQKHLGSGSYGVVASFHDSDRGRDVAIKRVRKVFDNYLVLRRTLREIRLMSHFRHPNLMRLHKVLPIDPNGGDLYMSLELMDCDLDTLVHTKRVVLTDQQVRCFTAQILLGLMAMHAGHVIHRDLKPANIFVRLNRGQIKIGDLGLSRGIAVNDETGEATHPSDEVLTEYVVTRWYRAPEVLLARSKYGPSVDVWSVGCIVYEMCSRKALFPGKNSYDQLKRILGVLGGPSEADTSWVPRESMGLLQKCYPSGSSSARGQGLSALASTVCSPDCVDLLQQMCLFNPNLRIGVEQALLHSYLAGITSEQDRKTARAVDPADVTYDKMFDGVGRQGEGAALVQLGRLLRREVAKFNPMQRDTTPERSQAERDRTQKMVSGSVRTPRGGPQSMIDAIASSGSGSARAKLTSDYDQFVLATSARSKGLTEQQVAALGSSDRADRTSSSQQSTSHPELQYRRRSEPEADVWARRSAQGTVIPSSRVAASSSTTSALPLRRRSADDGRPTGAFDVKRLDRHVERIAPGEEPPSASAPLSLPLAPPASGPIPTSYWLSEDKSPAAKLSQRSARHESSSGSIPSYRRKVQTSCSGGSATTASTRATPPGSRPGTEASTRASSRLTSTSRPRIPSVGPSWVSEPEGFYLGPAGGLNEAATASPRAGAPVLSARRDEPRGRNEEGSSTRRSMCWVSEEVGDAIKADRYGLQADRSLQRGLRESASTSNPGLPPDVSNSSFRQDSLASLDDVLREMKAMIRNAPDESLRDDSKQAVRSRPSSSLDTADGVERLQERLRQISSKASASSKPASSRTSKSSTGLRGHRLSAVGRGADTADDRSPSTHRQSLRRPLTSTRTERSERPSLGRQRSHDELDFAVSEPFHVENAALSTSMQAAGEATVSPCIDGRRPLESLEPEVIISPSKDLGPPTLWARGSSVRSLRDNDQDWANLQSNWYSSNVGGSGKAHTYGSQSQRQLSRSGSTVKRAPASENHMSNANVSGIGFVF